MAPVDVTPAMENPSGKEIEIQIGDVVFTAKLLDHKAPKTCAGILSLLPYENITYHQFWSGSGMQVHGPILKQMAEDYGLWPSNNFPDYSENPSIYGCPGDIGFYPVGNGIFISYGKTRFYGPPEGVEPTYIFAEITEDLDKLKAMGRTVGRHGQQVIKIREKK